MPNKRQAALDYAQQHKTKFIDTLKEVLTIPSISTDPGHAGDIARAADWMADQLRKLGVQDVRVMPTARHPVVYGEWVVEKDKPTVLIYGHYDVQPADPIDLWESDPFTPTQRGDNLYARGASDMKGQTLAVIKALESIIRTSELPVNVKWLLEGEEEIGSPSLPEFLTQNKNMLTCDVVLNPDSGMLGADSPSITYALRGIAYFELRVYGPKQDLHSGIYGGIGRNPANALAALIAGLHDDKGRITLPGFYNKVRPITKEEKKELARLPLSEKHYLARTGFSSLYGEEGYTAVERTGARPALDVNGLTSGFTGEGAKTIIPSMAMAKISMRLVPDQDPKEVQDQLKQYLKKNAPKDIRWELDDLHGGKPSLSTRDNIGVKAMENALEMTWGKRPFFKREGGSVPVVGHMQDILGVDSVLTGFGLPDDNLHGPNEKIHIPTWYRGIDALIHFFMNLSG